MRKLLSAADEVEPTAFALVDAKATTLLFFFSSRLGCLGSLLVSIVVTVILLAVLRR
jgi:hypothetical protein